MTRSRCFSARTLAGTLLVPLVAATAGAQTDYYNTDAGRPLTIEDAHPVERRAFELQLAPLRIERAAGGVYTWGLEPELAYGILPYTHLEIGLPLAWRDAGQAGAAAQGGIAGLELGLFHNLNVETAIPALGIAIEALLPIGGLAPDATYLSSRGIATKTFTWARFHLNGQYTFGDEPGTGESAGVHEVSRWMGGLAIDRAFPLRALLLGGEVVARQPIHADEEVAWDAGVGVRYQYGPRTALDAGIGRALTGDAPVWSFTVGAAYAFGMPWRGR